MKRAGMTIEKAIERLREEYEKARAAQYVNDPVAYALNRLKARTEDTE